MNLIRLFRWSFVAASALGATACLPSREGKPEDAPPTPVVNAPPRMRLERGLVTGSEWGEVPRAGTEGRDLPLWVTGSTWKVRPIVAIPLARPEERTVERGDLAPVFLVFPDAAVGGGASRVSCQYRYRDAENRVRDPDRRIEADFRRARTEESFEWWLGVSPLLVDFPGGPSWEHIFDCYARGGAQEVDFELRVQFSLPAPQVRATYLESNWKGDELRRIFRLSVEGSRPARIESLPLTAVSLFLRRHVERADWSEGDRPQPIRVAEVLPLVRLRSRGLLVWDAAGQEMPLSAVGGVAIAPGQSLLVATRWGALEGDCSPKSKQWARQQAWRRVELPRSRGRSDADEIIEREVTGVHILTVSQRPIREEWLEEDEGMGVGIGVPDELQGSPLPLREDDRVVATSALATSAAIRCD